MINFEKLQDDDFKIKIIEDRWKINLDEYENILLVDKLEQYGVDFIWQDQIMVPTNLTYIGGDGFSSVYKINNNDELVIKVTNEKAEIKFAKELIQRQQENDNYFKHFVRSQVLIPSLIKTSNYTEDYYKYDNVYIILEKLNPLTLEQLKLIDDFDNYVVEITGDALFQDFRDFDDSGFKSHLDDYLYSNFEDTEDMIFLNDFGEFYRDVVHYVHLNNWYDFNPKNIMLDNNNNFKIIDLQSGK